MRHLTKFIFVLILLATAIAYGVFAADRGWFPDVIPALHDVMRIDRSTIDFEFSEKVE